MLENNQEHKRRNDINSGHTWCHKEGRQVGGVVPKSLPEKVECELAVE
jgi:hypothetical protein